MKNRPAAAPARGPGEAGNILYLCVIYITLICFARIEGFVILCYVCALRQGETPCFALAVLRTQATARTTVFKQTLRQHLEKVFPDQELTRWFDPLGLSVDHNQGVVHVSFPHAFFGQWFLRHVRQDFEREMACLAKDMEIVYEQSQRRLPAQAPAPPSAPAPPAPSLRLDATHAARSGNGAPNGNGAAPALYPDHSKARDPHTEHCLTPPEQFTFSTFLVNRKNDFPLAAARESVTAAGRPPYTPLVIYGPSGAGKSHLLGAMAHAALSDKRSFFYGDVTFLEQIKRAPGIYTSISQEMIFLDDVQRVAACQDLQEALQALIDMCQPAGRLLVLSLDAHPSTCAGLGQKLRSRLASGLVLEIKRPDLDIRRQYLQRENNRLDLGLHKEQVLELAQHYQDIRTIDGAVTRLCAFRALLQQQDGGAKTPVDISVILNRGGDQSMLNPAAIILTVARFFSLPPEDISGKSRNKTVTLARHMAILLCRELLGLSLVRIGRVFAGRDHSSVLYSIKKIKQLQASDRDVHNQVEELRKLCATRH